MTRKSSFTSASRRRPTFTAAALIALAGLQSPAVHATPITSAFTGAWFDPSKNGQGLQVQVVGDQQPELLLYWYTYDASGRPLWLYGQTPLVSSNRESVTLNAFEVTGPRFMQQGATPRLVPFGQLTLSFSSCNAGTLTYNTSLGVGSSSLVRLSNTYGQGCTGTLLDDRLPTQVSDSPSTTVAGIGTIRSNYREEPGKIRFQVEVERLPVGSYVLLVDGIARAPITVIDTPNGPRGEVEFRSPVEPGKLPLNFDPRNKPLQLMQNGVVIVGGGNGVGAPGFGNSVSEIALLPSAGAASGKAKLKREPNKVSFSVEAEDVPAGSYAVFVGGIMRGSLQATLTGTRVKGEIEWANPLDAGKPILDFDPRGQRIEVRSGSTVVLSTTFPSN